MSYPPQTNLRLYEGTARKRIFDTVKAGVLRGVFATGVICAVLVWYEVYRSAVFLVVVGTIQLVVAVLGAHRKLGTDILEIRREGEWINVLVDNYSGAHWVRLHIKGFRVKYVMEPLPRSVDSGRDVVKECVLYSGKFKVTTQRNAEDWMRLLSALLAIEAPIAPEHIRAVRLHVQNQAPHIQTLKTQVLSQTQES